MFNLFATKKEEYVEKKYKVDDEDGLGKKRVVGLRHKSGLAIRKRENDYAIDILTDQVKLYEGISSQQNAKSIIADERIQGIDWKSYNVRERVTSTPEKQYMFKQVKQKHNQSKNMQYATAGNQQTHQNQQQQKPKQQQQKPKQQQQQQNRQQQQKPKQQMNSQNSHAIHELKENSYRKKKEQQQLQNAFYLIAENNGMFAVAYGKQEITNGFPEIEKAKTFIEFLKNMHDFEKLGFPGYLPDDNGFGYKFVQKNKKAIIENKAWEKNIPQDVIIENYFGTNQEIIRRYPIYWESILELRKMIGMNKVKQQVQDLTLQLVGKQKMGFKGERESMHMVFRGPAGTGKTVVTELITKILYSLGYLEKMNTIKATRDELVAPNIGGTEQKTKQKIQEAIGGVLFIDEAYALHKEGMSNDFGNEAVNILIKEMEDRRSEFIVILAGYEKEMNDMIKMNPGLESRIKSYIDFENYTLQELEKIALMMEKKVFETTMTKEARKYLSKVIEHQMDKKVLDGNARKVRKIMEEIGTKYFAALGENKADKMVGVEDIKKVYSLEEEEKENGQKTKTALDKMNELYGMTELKEQMKNYISKMQYDKLRAELSGKEPKMGRMHMTFKGPSGTGKTTVANIMAEFLVSLGYLKKKEVLEVTRKDLVAEYTGQTAIKVQKAIQQAMGGVLFIDEAYSLVNGENDSFGHEAVTELIAAMEKYKDDFVVILAGYEKDIDKLFATNEGFKSRIAKEFIFKDYTAEEIIQMVRMQIKKEGYTIKEDAFELLKEKFQEYAEENDGLFEGNGRWAYNLVNRMGESKAVRVMSSGEATGATIEELTTLEKPDVIKAFE